MVEVLDMKTAIERTIALVTASKVRPFIGSVFGVPDSGKSYFIDYVLGSLEAQGLWTRQRWIKENWNRYEMFAHGPNHGNITRYSLGSQVFTRDAVLYHCPWENRAIPWKNKEDPEVTLRRYLDRGLDLSVGIFNPKRSLEPIGKFDFIISNPKSSEKSEPMLDSW